MSSSTSLIASTIVSTFPSTMTTTYTYNSSTSDQPNQSSESGLTTAYIGLIIAIIGFAGTFLVQYNIKKVKLCCVNLDCNKKDSVDLEAYKLSEPIIVHTVPEPLVDIDITSIIFPDSDTPTPTVRFSQESNIVESTF